jgi:translation elongation factor EF-1beta
LIIGCVIEDLKVSTDDLEEEMVALEDFVQSVDIASFSKI